MKGMGAPGTPDEVTGLLRDVRAGDERALERLLPLVYEELRLIARRQMSRERPEHTLDSTDLVHEAYVRLVDRPSPDWRDRAHFYGIASRCMRQVLVDHARARGAAKRGGDWERTSLTNHGLGVELPLTELIALDEALEELGELDARLLQVVEYRFFAGLEEREIAELLGVSARTVQRDWVAARTWLYREMWGAR